MKFQVESQTSMGRYKANVNLPPASLQDWLDEQLERRGIDAVIYTRYILSILLQDTYDLESCEHDAADMCSYYFCDDRRLKSNRPSTNNRGGQAKRCCDKYIYNDCDCEQRKKYAAVECLMSVSDEKYGIEELVEDLYAKLKELQLENENIDKFKPKGDTGTTFTDVGTDTSSIEEQAKQYYAAFPALSRQSVVETSDKEFHSRSCDVVSADDTMLQRNKAWTRGGRQLVFDCHIVSLSDERKDDDDVTAAVHDESTDVEREINITVSSSSTEVRRPTFIVPKLKPIITNHNHQTPANYSTTFNKFKPPFRVCGKEKGALQPRKCENGNVIEEETQASALSSGEIYSGDVTSTLENDPGGYDLIAKEADDEILAKFVEKFNDDNMAAIWDTMLQPSYFDSVFEDLHVQWNEPLLKLPLRNSLLSVWSNNDGVGSSILSDDRWFESSFRFVDRIESIAGFEEKTSLDGVEFKRMSVALSDADSDDLSALSQIFKETCKLATHSSDERPALDESTDSGNVEKIETEPTMLSDLKIAVPAVDDFDETNGSCLQECLLTSVKTHFRPIKQGSSDTDDGASAAKIEDENLIGADVDFANESNYERGIDAVSGNEEIEDETDSRDSWSPDMKACFSNSSDRLPLNAVQSEGYSSDACSDSNVYLGTEKADRLSLDGEIDVASTVEESLLAEPSDVRDVAASPKKLPEEPWMIDSSCLWHDIAGVESASEPRLLTVDPWKSEASSACKPCEERNAKDFSVDYVLSWKRDALSWKRDVALPKAELKQEKENSRIEKFSESSWINELSASASDSQSSLVVEALRVEIKEETAQLFDDIQEMVRQDNISDDDDIGGELGQDIDDEALQEWIIDAQNENLANVTGYRSTSSLPQLESQMVEDVLKEGEMASNVEETRTTIVSTGTTGFVQQFLPSLSVEDDNVIYSSQLEEEWIKSSQKFNVQVPKINGRTSCTFVKTERRPCSFFLDGNCRRTDCKFSHDLSTVTCRFWEEGCCFKGITCPFLHGYAQFCSTDESDADNGASLNLDDFPDIKSNENTQATKTSSEPHKNRPARQKHKRYKRRPPATNLLQDKK